MRKRAPWIQLLALTGLLGGVLLALAYEGPLQRGLDLWTQGRAEEALSEFRRQENVAKPAGLGRLNRLIAEAEVVRMSGEPLDTKRRSLLRISGDLAKEGGSGAFKTIAMYHAGCLALDGGDATRGVKLLESAYRQDSRNQAIANRLLGALMAGSDLNRLRETARHHVNLRPDNPKAWFALGEAERRTGFPRRALTNWNRGIGVYPLRPMLESGIILAQEQGRPDLVRAWLGTLRFRYATVADGRSIHAWCDSLKLDSEFAALPPDVEAKRYLDRFPEFFPAGREWTYKVKYGIIPLGQLKVGVLGREDIKQGAERQEAWRVYYKIDSNSAYRMLIDLHDVYQAVIPLHCLNSVEFVLRKREGNDRSDRIYTFHPDNAVFQARGYHNPGDIFKEELPLARQVFDGLSILFAARRQVREGRYGSVLTVVDEEMHRTDINGRGRGQEKIMGRQRKVVYVHGKADYQGIAGLTGEFWGTFGDDREALPLAARFQIKLGKISLELEEVADGVAKP